MRTKIFNGAVLIIINMAIFFINCTPKFDCANTNYSFATNIKAYPDLDSIKVNDTIWLEYNTPTQLTDIVTNKIIDYSQAGNLGIGISYLELIGGNFNDPGAIPAANFFDNILVIGTSVQNSQTDQVREFLFTETSGAYQFKMGIVPKKKGLFSIGIGDAANVYRKNDACTKAFFSITFKDTNQHLYLYEQSRPGYTPSEYEQTHVYCFKVN